MTMKNPIGWVEIPVTDMDRAEAFYKDYFGLDTTRQPEQDGISMSFFDMDMESYGSAATLTMGEPYTPSHQGSTVYFPAPDGGTVEAGLAKAEQMGIKVLFPKLAIGEHGFIAWIEDSEGNRIAIHSMEG